MSDEKNNQTAGAEARADAERAAKRLGDDASRVTREAMDEAQRMAQSQADRAKGAAASEMSSIADSLRKAAQDMREGSPQERTLGQIAETLADASEAIRDRDMSEIAGDVSAFARRNPMAFLGGAALAGFAATRFAKASASTPRASGYNDGGEVSDYGTHRSGRTGYGSAASGPSTVGRSETVGAAQPSDTIPGPATSPVPGADSTTDPIRPAPVTTIPEDRS